MDHLPQVENPWDPVDVPHLGGVYLGTSFIEYPRDEGWDLEQLQQGIIEEDKRYDAACFVQEWLFFGVLETVLVVDIDAHEFLDLQKDEDGEVTFMKLTTKSLPKYMDQWKDWLNMIKNRESQDEYLQYKTKATACLHASYEAWSGFKDFQLVASGEAGRPGIVVGRVIELAICILGTTLEHALNRQQVLGVGERVWLKAKSEWLVERMLDEGWCPSTLDHIRCPLNNTTLYYASQLGPPSQPRGYEDKPPRHTECRYNEIACERRLVKDEAYETAHWTPECDCAFVGPTRDDLTGIIGSKDPYSLPEAQLGGIMLVYWDEDSQTLRNVPYTPDKQYTAISHVWSDGRGNVNSNSLPTCQVKLITTLLHDLPWTKVSVTKDITNSEKVWAPLDEATGETYDEKELDKQPKYFWMDTLCVPCHDNDIDDSGRSLRQAAMLGMRAVYGRANRVLVLDSDLMQVVGDPSEEEIRMRIFLSTWNRRLWTLQEYVLGRAVWFQFGNRVIMDSDDDNTDLDEDWNNEILRISKTRGLRLYAKGKVFDRVSHIGDAMRVMMVWQSLRRRSAKNANDVPICVGTLLDHDLVELMSVPPEDRLAKHWSMYESIPAGILMLPGPKLNQPELRWAPTQMTDCEHAPSPTVHPMIRHRDGRLLLALQGITIGRVDGGTTGRRSVIALDLDGEMWYVRQNLRRANASWYGIDFRKREEYALIVGEETLMIDAPLKLSGYLVALVKIKSRDPDGTINVEWMRASSLLRRGGPWDAPAQWTVAQREEKKILPVIAARTPQEQWWSIS